MPVKISDYARLGIQKQERDFSSNKNNQTTSGNKGFDFGKALISPFTTIADINEDVLSGVGKSLEGIVDYGLGLVGSAASIFGSNDLERALSEAIKYDFTGNTIGKMDDWAEDSSWLSGNNWVSNTVHQVGQGVGGMLPGIVVTLATGGAAAPAALASMSGLLGTATFAAGAAGQSTEEALHEGANIGQATAFGTLTGATEGAIEYISGGLGGLNPFTKGAAGKILSGGAGKVIRSFAEEGLEEVASDLITPAWKAITYSGKYETPEINELINSFTTGGLTALAMGGAGKATNMAMYGKEGEKALSKLNEIQELNEEEYNLEKKGELNEEKAKEFADKREGLVKEFKDLTDSLDKESKKYQRLDERINVDKSIENAKNFDVRWEAAKEALFHNNKNTGQNYTLEMEDIKNKNINGYIDKENNRIVVNKNAKDPVAIVVGHEVTHGLEKSGAYNEVKDLILSKMSAEELQEQRNELLKIKQYKKAFDKDGNIALDKEIVANWLSNNMTKDSKSLIQTFKGKGNVLERLLGFAKNKLSTLTKGTQTYNEYQDVVDAINKAMDTLKKQNIRENRTVEEKINDLKSNTENESVAYSVASATTPSVRVESKNGEVTYKTTQEITEESFYERFLAEGKKEDVAKMMAKEKVAKMQPVIDLMKEMGDKFQAIGKYNDIVPYYKPNGELGLSCVVKNNEYELNIDFTTICKKREMFSRFLDDYVEKGYAMEEGITADNIEGINVLLKQYGFENACSVCFVESRRKNINKWADDFLTKWNKLIEEYSVNAEEFSTIEKDNIDKVDTIYGITDKIAFEIDNMLSYDKNALEMKEEEFVESKKKRNTYDRMRQILDVAPEQVVKLTKQDLIDVKRMTIIKQKYPMLFSVLQTSYGSNAPKPLLPSAPYASDILLNDKFSTIIERDGDLENHTKEIGGVRMQSFSDFQITKLLDYANMILDLEATKAVAHTYTKELDFVRFFGKTGIKINMSLVTEEGNAFKVMKEKFMAEGLKEKRAEELAKEYVGLNIDENGNFTYAFADESVDFKKACELQEDPNFKGDAGTVLVGISNKQIETALDDDRIKMIIPYHSSGLPIHTRTINNMKLFTDYTRFQSTKGAGKKDPFTKVFYEAYQKYKGNSKKAADAYLKYCKENGYTPRFERFSKHPNYYKLLIDFTSDGGNGTWVQQRPVTLELTDNFHDVAKRAAAEYNKTYEEYYKNQDEILGKMEYIFNNPIDRGVITDAKKRQILGQELTEEQKILFGEKHEKIKDSKIQYSITSELTENDIDDLDSLLQDEEDLLIEEEFEIEMSIMDREERLGRALTEAEKLQIAEKVRKYNIDKKERLQKMIAKEEKEWQKLELAQKEADMLEAMSESERQKYLIRKKKYKERAAKAWATRRANQWFASIELGNKTATFKESTLNNIVEESKLYGGGQKLYVAKINPKEFIKLTAPSVGIEQLKRESRPLDIEKLQKTTSLKGYRESGTISNAGMFLLRVHQKGNKYVVVDHNGRHRMIALMMAGYNNIPIKVYVEWTKLDGDVTELEPQIFESGAKSMGKGKLRNVIEVKESNMDAILEDYIDEDSDIQYSIRRSKNPPKGQLELELDFDAKEKQRKPVEPSTRKVAKEMKEYNRQQNLTEQDIDKVIADTEKKVEVVLPADKKSTMQVVKDKFKEAKEAFKSGRLATYLKTQITDASAGVVDKVKAKYKDNKELRNSKVKQLRISVNEAQRATARADWYIGTVVDKIWSPIEAKGEAYVRSFETFLLHKLNIRRMRFSATALNNIAKLEKELDAKLVELADKYNKGGYKNKKAYELDVSKTKSKYATKITSWQEEYDNAKDAPVFGKEITAKESEEAAKKLLKEHPEFAEYKEQVADVFEYLRKKQLEAGLISETQFELMEKAAGRDYVPTHRVNKDGISKAALSGNIGVKNGLHRAKGSSEDIRSIMVQMCEQVIAVEKKTSINKLFNTVKDMIPEEFTDDKIVSREPVGREDADSNIIPKENEVFFYENGERVVYQVDGEVASLFQSMRNIPSQFELGVFGKASKGLVKLTRNVTTQYNPFFAARNLFRDYFDAVIYTKNKGNFSQNYVEAAKDVFGKGKWYKMYMENGGASASFYNQDQGRDMSKKGILTKISDFNETIELIPRVAEMKATYERLIAEGKTHEEAIQEAMFDAAEVTVNFGKGGTSTKWLSSNLVPYLNGAVQGSVKFYDTFIHPESFEAWKSAMVRAGLMAIPALILNEALFGDDDDYEELADDVKANYYLFKIGDNKFIRIPRGRIEAIFGDFAQRTVRYAKGNEDAFDTYGETIKSSVSPVESFTRTVYSPLKDVSTNTAWHGGKIENRSMENKPIKERYDENTSEIAKMLSNVYPKLSPKKWHYLLDQYSGVIGDIVLPLTSKSASIETVLFKSSGYYVNSMNNNKYSNKYYDLGAELTQNSNSNNATGVDKAKLRYYNSMNTKISELKKSKDGLSNEEAEATQLLIVQLQRQTIDNLKAFETTLNKYEYGLSDSDTYEDFYRESLRECFGAETALLSYDNRVYEKATIFNKCGINWDTFYTVYFDAKSIDSDYDADGNVVSGSKKNKVTNYVKSLKLNATQKYMVMGLLGYKNTNGESQVRSLLRSKGYTGEQLESVMKMCGYGK